jgi:predicted transcriptional regulator
LQAKQTVRALLDRLPDNCTLDDVQYHLYVLQSIERGRADAEAGRTMSHEDVARELRKRWLANAAG